MRLYGSDTQDPVQLVTGLDGLSCAIRGTVEGADCDLQDYLLEWYPWQDNAQPDTGFDQYLELIFTPNWSGEVDVYVVRRRANMNDDVGGAFEEVAGATIVTYSVDTSYCTDIPVVPDVEEEVAAALTPSTADCSRPAESCASPDFDKIPLEDELSSEGDGAYEQSWRHYLTLARLAADEADALGEQVIANGLQMDMRAEQAIDELEDICGGSINIDALVDPELDDAIDPTDCSTTACPDGYACQGGSTCVLDPLAMALERAPTSADEQRLHECLGDDVIERFVTLGSRPVCIWHDDDNENRICADAGPGQQCPYVSYDGTCDLSSLPSGKVPVLIETNLGFFDTDGGARVGADPPCDRLRLLRNSARTAGDHAWDLARLEVTDFFDPSNVRAYAQRLSWEARPGEYSAVMLDGAEWISTGNLFDGTNETAWPCAAQDSMAFPGCAGEERGLFCDSYTCPDADQRRALNYRLAGAVLAARITAGVGLESVRLPWTDNGYAWWDTATDRTTSSSTVLRSGDLRRFETSSDYRSTWSGASRPTTYCSLPSTTLWRPIGESGVAPSCSSSGSTGAFWVEPGPKAGADALVISGSLWSGLGTRRGFYYSRPDIGPIFKRMLGSRDRFVGTTVYLGPSTPDVESLTSYWVSDDWESPSLFGTREVEGISEDALPVFDGLTALEMLDAMEMICEAARGGGWNCDTDAPPRVTSPGDLDSARSYMHCVASSIERAGELTVFANMPSQAIESLGRTSGTGAYPGVGGEYGAQISSLRAGLVELGSVPRLVGSELRHMSNDIDRLRLALARLETRREMANIEFLSSISNQLANCAGAAGGVLAGNFGAAATCANSVAQINFAAQLNELTESDLELAGEESLLDFRDRFESRATTLADLSERLVEAAEQVDGALARLESLRRRGRRSLSKALFLDSEPGGRHFNVNTVMRRRMNTDQKRYERAHAHAVKMAYLAKLAVEQRLGMRLADLTDDMSLVEPPSTWESTLCASSGIDYHRIRTAGLIEDDDYSDAYIGEYVRRLERVVESYRLDFPFQNGSDTSVVSLRDEIHNVRAQCEVEVHNLLVHTESLAIADPTTTEPGWRITGCAEPPPGDAVIDCLGISPLTGLSDGPFAVPHPDLAAPRAHRIQFGPSIACGDPCEAMVTPDTVLEQAIELGPGRYRLSWYGRAVGMDLPPEEALSIVFADPENGTVGTTVEMTGSGGEWNRYYFFVTLTTAQTVRAVVSATIPGTPAPGYVGPAVDVAGIMLEDVTEQVVGVEDTDEMVGADEYVASDFPPREFVGTAHSPTRDLAICEDTTGEAFRTGWTRGCLRLCAAGYGRECPGEAEAVRYCYWETEFAITQRDIERGRLIHSGGFARGNYNYRIDTLALNFVGSAARQCGDARLPSTCYSAAYVPYSLDHIGRYTVRNHRGEDYEAPLFQGHIEHGRGLAAERYITNPISSADRGLIEPYMHREFRGRPIDGVYRLRVWEEPGVNFEGIEDVQLVLNYRYWTRFE